MDLYFYLLSHVAFFGVPLEQTEINALPIFICYCFDRLLKKTLNRKIDYINNSTKTDLELWTDLDVSLKMLVVGALVVAFFARVRHVLLVRVFDGLVHVLKLLR